MKIIPAHLARSLSDFNSLKDLNQRLARYEEAIIRVIDFRINEEINRNCYAIHVFWAHLASGLGIEGIPGSVAHKIIDFLRENGYSVVEYENEDFLEISW